MTWTTLIAPYALILGALAAGLLFERVELARLGRLAQRTRSEGDNSNLLALIGTRQEKQFTGGATLDDTYNTILAEIGTRISQAQRLSQNQDSITAALTNQRSQLSGVSIDEEVGQLILQQQAYSAAAKAVSFSRENITTLLQMIS